MSKNILPQLDSLESEKQLLEKYGKDKDGAERAPETKECETGPERASAAAGLPERANVGEMPREGEGGLGAAVTAGRVRSQQARIKEIEKVLEEDLEDIYAKLPPDKQKEFRTVGEITAKQINNLLAQAKVRMKKIIDLIRTWLSIIPGINKFFLEQEAKIKADKVMELRNSKDSHE